MPKPDAHGGTKPEQIAENTAAADAVDRLTPE